MPGRAAERAGTVTAGSAAAAAAHGTGNRRGQRRRPGPGPAAAGDSDSRPQSLAGQARAPGRSGALPNLNLPKRNTVTGGQLDGGVTVRCRVTQAGTVPVSPRRASHGGSGHELGP